MTFRPIIPALLLLGASLPCTAQGSASDYLEQEPHAGIYESPMHAALALAGGYPEFVDGSPSLQLSLTADPDTADQMIMVIRIAPTYDHSTLAEEWRVVLEQLDYQQWRIAWMGLRQQCSRGPDDGEWGPHLCP